MYDKLEYLQSLGVTCLWLLPFFPSPLRDDGYDIADYTSVHPTYGTLDDFKKVLEAAHERGMRVVIELGLNHTSEQDPWFQRARAAPAGSPERDCYVSSDTDQKFQDVRIIFVDSERSNWTWDPARLYSPVVMDPVYGYQAVNVEAQESDAASLLPWMRNMIR